MNLDPSTRAYSHPCDKKAGGRGTGLFIHLSGSRQGNKRCSFKKLKIRKPETETASASRAVLS